MYYRVQTNNSTRVGKPKHYDVREDLSTIENTIIELVELKNNIHNANIPVYGDIFRLSELKNFISRIQSMSTEEGPQSGRYNEGDYELEAQMNSVEKENLIEHIEEEIDKIQSRLDKHNATTELDQR